MNNKLLTRFNSLTDREQLIFIATLLILIWSAWDNFFYQPLSAEKKQYTAELSEIENQQASYQQTATDIETQGKLDPNLVNKKKLSQVKSQLEALKSQLGLGEKEFVSAHKMAGLLTDMLKQNNGLTLVKLETLPVTTLSDDKQQQSWVYRHGLSLTLRGNFINTVNYLKSLQSLPWQFSWDSVNYQVIHYPVAETTLRLYTLSFEEDWLGL